ncbi:MULTISPECIES: type II toxin-antitoxin system PemK/MazF family toxin [Planococcus]|uniref:Type II toxin-antitoxin system PemK/MazF family toxin n=1 Tax=Planococcus faecalis TaxID=1598147 RepID=A0ABM6ISF9_9BACL|nr:MULTISPECIES: type II toxin-antitoxin system PemK/MazF family toxin [Planococcus]AQU79278.1 hypothetical protein AJGP001_08370 [Planococcus faecalis]MDJ0333366.1 type II toxin-antitoxin system PemK/MazF family toxin [Planococcus sp. S3-L1]OHX52312.1 hypothetical protein BB777_12965 [Planococcus faecalis]
MTRFFKVGDIIKVDMSPAKEHEQQGYRLAIVVSEENVHKETDLIWVLPITNTNKAYPTHVPVNGRTKNNKNSVVNNQATGYVLCEKIKAIDPLARAAKLTDEADQELIEECKAIIDAITFIG